MSPAPRVVVLLHGYEGNGPAHWQTWLAEVLPQHGVRVRYPALPEPFEPDLRRWVATLDEVLDEDPASGRVVVAHSLACHLWAHRASAAASVVADRVLLVAPPGVRETAETFPALPPGPMTAPVLGRASPSSVVVLGERDPWRSDPADFRDAGIPVVDVPGGAHLNVDAGLGPWPAVLEWVLAGGGGPDWIDVAG